MDRIDDLRAEIDEIDDKIKALLIKRLDLSRKIGIEKKKSNLAVYDANREKCIVDGLTTGLDESEIELISNVYAVIFEQSKKAQK